MIRFNGLIDEENHIITEQKGMRSTFKAGKPAA